MPAENMSNQPPPQGNPRLSDLVRPEAVRGKAWARLSRPSLVANASLRLPVTLSVLSLVALVALVAWLPVPATFRHAGIVTQGPRAAIVRSPKAGQLESIAAVAQSVSARQPVAVVAQSLRTDGDRDPRLATSRTLAEIDEAKRSELRLVEERHEASLAQLASRERVLKTRQAGIEQSLANMRSLAEHARKTEERLTTEAAGFITRMDALSIAERATSASNRLLELRMEQDRISAELQDIRGANRIQEIDYQRSAQEIHRRYLNEEMALVDRSAQQGFSLPSPIDGVVRAAYKKPGAWISPGDELLLIETSRAADDDSVIVRVPCPANLINQVVVGQRATVWLNPHRRDEPARSGKVVAVEQSADDGSSGAQLPEARLFAVNVALTRAPSGSQPEAIAVRVGSEVEVELLLSSQRLYEAILPTRVTRRDVTQKVVAR